MSFSFSCTRTTPAPSPTSASARIRRSTSSRWSLGSSPGRMKNENSRMYGAPRVFATSAACRARSRCGSKSSSTKIFPIGEPMLETLRPCRSRVSCTVASWVSSRSRMLTPQALRISTYFRPRPAATEHWVSKSSEISSTNPDRVHIVLLHAPCGQSADQVALEDEVEDDDRCRTDQGSGHHLRVHGDGPALHAGAEHLEGDGGRMRVRPGHHRGEQDVVPAEEEGEDPGDDDRRPAEREDDPGKDLDVGGAVDARRLLQLPGQPAQVGDHDPRRERQGEGQVRDEQPPQGADDGDPEGAANRREEHEDGQQHQGAGDALEA